MSANPFAADSLVLYKNRPARVTRSGEKIEIELDDGQTVSVRPKDVQLLHPGPLRSLRDLKPVIGDLNTAWELLAGSSTHLPELAELIYDEYTPAAAWAAWQHVADGLYFRGTPAAIEARTAEAVAHDRNSRAAKAAEERAWANFVDRARAHQFAAEDKRFLVEVEELALGRRQQSRVLHTLGRTESPEDAHALLLEVGYWSVTRNPYPIRLNLPTTPPVLALPPLPHEARLDLTHLPALAIDDAGNQDPDDALSLEPGRLWVHVADVAALVPPDSLADQEARARSASLYLPEGTASMLPPEATGQLGLGLNNVSPALSFGLAVNDAGQPVGFEIKPSWVRVQRLTYGEAETRLYEEPLAGLYRLAQAHLARRTANGAINLDLPEVKLRVVEGQVEINPILPLRSRDLVTETMLMCGAAVAQFVLNQNIPIPYILQPPPEEVNALPGLAGMFARRRAMKPGQRQVEPGPHTGLGLSLYTQVTSPLRRYPDLLVHQQLRAYLQGGPLLTTGQILERLGVAEAASGSLRQAERLARRHWTLVYLMQHPGWQGEGIVVEKQGPRGLILIPELDLETWLFLPAKADLNSPVRLTLSQVNLPWLEPYFKVDK
jgi:exoribonuclease-2